MREMNVLKQSLHSRDRTDARMVGEQLKDMLRNDETGQEMVAHIEGSEDKEGEHAGPIAGVLNKMADTKRKASVMAIQLEHLESLLFG